ncbi:hypothetical protein [Pseudomonas fluorescens]|nr:hypothetical protein [Pseudomonas fluorescens]
MFAVGIVNGLAVRVKGSPADYRELLAQAAWRSIRADASPDS